MSTASEYEIQGLDLTDDRYEVEQSLVRNKHKPTDARGDVVLRGKQEMFELKERFPFVDGDENGVFEVKADGVIDVAGNYVLPDAQATDRDGGDGAAATGGRDNERGEGRIGRFVDAISGAGN